MHLETGCACLMLPRSVLQSGKIVVAKSSSNWATQSSSFDYTVITPTVPDKDAYIAQLNVQIKIAAGIADGVPIKAADGSQSYTCNIPQPSGSRYRSQLRPPQRMSWAKTYLCQDSWHK